MEDPIVVDGVSKYYEDFLALNDLTLRVKRDEDVALLGPNGAGKTTLLKILCGLLRPSSGSAYIDGIDVTKNREKAVSRIGTILETPEFYPYLTPSETLRYLGRLRDMDEGNLENKIEEKLGMVKIKRWSDTKIEKFSRGMKQRLALAQALLHDPPIVLFDEPSLGLDPRGIADVREILKEEREGKTVFFASHQLSEVEQICNQVAIIDHGKLHAYDSLSSLSEEYGSFEEAYLELTEDQV